MMKPFHKRLAELWCKAMHGGKLTTSEKVEWIECLHANMHWVSKLNRLENLMFCAELIGDQEEQNRIGEQMDQLIYKQ
jgi:hypothetical protein